MKIEPVVNFLMTLPNAKMTSDRTEIQCRCMFCGDSRRSSDAAHLYIRIDVESDQPMMFNCFRGNCGEHGILTTEKLQRLGCSDMTTLLELAKHNANISKKLDNNFVVKKSRDYTLVNLNNSDNKMKLKYINHRLGVELNSDDLKDLKIQLSLSDFVRLNNIHKLAFGVKMCELLDEWTVGFMSMYSDYLICRDFSDDKLLGEYDKPVTGRRYTMYRTSGTPSPDDTKLYCIPTNIDLLDSRAANINIAEGTFSILGAYLNTDIGKDRNNNIFLANCGTGYQQTINHVTKQYGLLKARINIFSDSEIDIGKYRKLYSQIKTKLDIRSFKVYYNNLAEDFGHASNDIEVQEITIV